MDINPATKQYLIFSAIVAFILSFIVNFMLVEMLKGTFAYGFPINLSNAKDFTLFLYRIINTVIEGAILTIPVYLFLQWLQNRR